ncbi:MAG: iron ABC transporter permease [Olsenella sp.]|nr:iron ABC transporter permease [Olsenella sp.]
MGKLGSKMREEARFRTGWLRVLVLVSVLALLVMSLLGLVLGASGVGAQDVLALLSGGKVAGSARSILVSIRIPRVLGGLLAGAAFASSGALIQAVLDNPLASPNIIGVNSGAGMAVLLVAALTSAGVAVPASLPVAAFLGALLASGLILAVSSRAGVSRLTVVLAGVAVNAVFGAGMNLVLTIAPNAYIGSSSYLVGGLSGVVLGDLLVPAALIVVGIVLALVLAARINVLALGSETCPCAWRSRGGASCGRPGMRLSSGWCRRELRWPHRLCRPHGPACGKALRGAGPSSGHPRLCPLGCLFHGSCRPGGTHGICPLRAAGWHSHGAHGWPLLHLAPHAGEGVPR